MKPNKQQAQDAEVITKNKQFNTEVTPAKFRYIDPYYQFTRRFDIGIGTVDPVLMFKQWQCDFWNRKDDDGNVIK